ncbi:PREDICTED: pumilio homolog 5 isoform X3 [Ipomoea nil]|uniref:pumilio homolog 5 isoform X3 n=1 Tax=Ipomoea nil TaxID=35883 RepID=UPI000900A12A|nr:PREDICTED: pumilio homolog 5 isoform X3 [Ipomoea nil]
MATENPMRIVESRRREQWGSSKDDVAYAQPMNEMAVDELGLLLKGHKVQGDNRNKAPNRSGSAPPSMEGSFAAFGNLIYQQSGGWDLGSMNLDTALLNCQSEEQIRSDPSYFAYYSSNVNLNPRLPPPIISRENRHLAHHVGATKDSYKFTSSGDSGDRLVHFPRGSLSTHIEEPEDENSTPNALDNLAESRAAELTGQNIGTLIGRRKSLVDLIQDDFARTPPLYSQSRLSGHIAVEEPTKRDIQALGLENLSLDIPKLPDTGSDSCNEALTGHSAAGANNSSILSFGETSYLETLGNPCSRENNKETGGDRRSRSELGGGGTGSDVSKKPAMVESKDDGSSSDQNEPVPQHPHSHRNTGYQVSGLQVQIPVHGMNEMRNGLEKGRPRFSSVEVQTVPQASGLTPPLYAAATTAYMSPGSPYYTNVNSPGLYSPQYSMGGYALGSAFLPPYMPGYPSHNSIPMQFDVNPGQSISGQTATRDIQQMGDFQHVNKFYGHHGLMMHPSLPDHFQMQYFQHPVDDSFNAPGQYVRFPSSLVGGPADPYATQKDPTVASYFGDQKFQPHHNGSLSTPSPRKMGVSNNSYYGSPTALGFMPQFPASPLGSPVLPGSPIGGAFPFGRRSEARCSQGSSRNVGVYSGWQGQRGSDNFNEPKKHSFLDELKANNARKIDLSDIAGRIVEFSVDQHGSRFIQQKLESCSAEEKASVFTEVLPHASKLMTDVFGNYVIQKALEVIDIDQKTELVHELDGHVMTCVRDQNGNHVIQKCIECVPTESIGFIISAFQDQVATLSTHPYGCRVIQRVLEHCSDDSQSQCIVDEILESAYVLAQDQYGNYVTQHVLERGKPHERKQIISKLSGKVVQLSQHKYASNVVEKCLEHGDPAERELLIDEILAQSDGNDSLLGMMKDQFANYVVQKILDISNDKQCKVLLSRIKVHLPALRKYTYGKHIVARFEQLSGEEE